MAPRTLGKFSVDDKVEVLSDEKGFSGAWALATITGIARGRLLVEFSRFIDEAGVAIREKVPPHRLRHVPLFPASFNVHLGLRVEGYLHDCWWPGEVVEQHARKGTRIQFDDGDAAWLVRSRVRPMLRRAPDPGGSADAGTAEAGGAVGAYDRHAPPPLCLPLRLPCGLDQHDAVAAVEEILARAGGAWQALRVSEVQARLEASLLPDEPAGWMGPWRHSLLGAIERALHSSSSSSSSSSSGSSSREGARQCCQASLTP